MPFSLPQMGGCDSSVIGKKKKEIYKHLLSLYQVNVFFILVEENWESDMLGICKSFFKLHIVILKYDSVIDIFA